MVVGLGGVCMDCTSMHGASMCKQQTAGALGASMHGAPQPAGIEVHVGANVAIE